MGCSVQESEKDESALTYGPVLVPKDQGYQVVSDPLNRAGSIRLKLSGVGESPRGKSLRLWKRRNLLMRPHKISPTG